MQLCVFVTNTSWDGVPRVRHQLAYLLSKHSTVLFIQKFSLNKISFFRPYPVERANNIFTLSFFFRLHHKLRFFGLKYILSFLDSLYVFLSVQYFLAWYYIRYGFRPHLNIISFCPDIFHLRTFFPHSTLCFFYHDDFVLQAHNLFIRNHVRSLLTQCFKHLDPSFVLVSSSILADRLKPYLTSVEPFVFLPWAQSSFSQPSSFSQLSNRRTLLYWELNLIILILISSMILLTI